MSKQSIDLTGRRFGRLTVLSLDAERHDSTPRKYWLCECECGNRISVPGYNLTKQRVVDCGCYSKEYVFLPYGSRREPPLKKTAVIKPSRECSIKKLNDDGCAYLLEAFLTNLVEDYFSAYNFYMDNRSDRSAKLSYMKLRRLFLSDYFATLTNLDGRMILDGLDRINEAKCKEVN